MLTFDAPDGSVARLDRQIAAVTPTDVELTDSRGRRWTVPMAELERRAREAPTELARAAWRAVLKRALEIRLPQPRALAAKVASDPRDSLSYELRGLVDQLLARHLRGENVQKSLVGGPLDGQRYPSRGARFEPVLGGLKHTYEALELKTSRKRRGPLVVYVHRGATHVASGRAA
jgi:hypothetical protein